MNWVELIRVNELVEAYALRAFLEAHEVDVLIPNEHSNRNTHPLSTTHGSMIALQVPMTQIELARELLREYNLKLVTHNPSDDDELPEELRQTDPTDVIVRDEVGKRALRAAIFGALVVPLILNLYSIKLLQEIYSNPRLLKDSNKSDLQLAIIFNILGLVFWSGLAYSIYLDWA
jgi:hypothetical protein